MDEIQKYSPARVVHRVDHAELDRVAANEHAPPRDLLHIIAMNQGLHVPCLWQPQGRYHGFAQIRETLYGSLEYAQDVHTNYPVAIKKSSFHKLLNANWSENFLREAYVHHSLPPHEHLIKMHGTAVYNKLEHWLVMDFFPGRDLVSHSVDGFSIDEAQMIFSSLLDATEVLHNSNICHLDISMENIMVDSSGHVKLVDFGQSLPFLRDRDGNVLPFAAGTVQNTCKAYCCAPELFAGHTSELYARPLCYGDKLDIFALGVCLYTMLQGRRPYEGFASYCHKINPEYHYCAQGLVGYRSRTQCYASKGGYCVRCGQLQQQASDSGEKYKGSSCRIPQEAAELIAKMLDLNPSNRISIADAKRSDFLRRTYHVNNR